jgi:hypothetical protein
MVLTLLAIMLGLLAVLVGAIVVSVLLAPVAPALVVESLSATDAMRCSRRLVSGSFWRVLGINRGRQHRRQHRQHCAGGGRSRDWPRGERADLALIGAVLVTSLLVKPFGVLVTVLLYFDQRLRRRAPTSRRRSMRLPAGGQVSADALVARAGAAAHRSAGDLDAARSAAADSIQQPGTHHESLLTRLLN